MIIILLCVSDVVVQRTKWEGAWGSLRKGRFMPRRCTLLLLSCLFTWFDSFSGVTIKEWDSLKGGNKVVINREEEGYLVEINLNRECDPHAWRRYFNASDYRRLKTLGIGPDEIIVQLEGKSIQTQVARTTDFCSNYYAVFQVPIGGEYRLKVAGLRKDFMATRSTLEFPEINYELILDTMVPGKLDYYVPHACYNSPYGGMRGYWVSNDTHFTYPAVSINQQCTGNDGKARRNVEGLQTNILINSDFKKDGNMHLLSTPTILAYAYKHTYI